MHRWIGRGHRHPQAAFVKAWRRRYKAAPDPYAAEAYDSVRMLLSEFARTVPARGGRRPARAALGARMAKATYTGVSRTYAFGDFHEYKSDNPGWLNSTFVHQVHDGRFTQRGSLAVRQRATEAWGQGAAAAGRPLGRRRFTGWRPGAAHFVARADDIGDGEG
ncbi:hypothetical protein AB0H30_10860 [Streptomyces pseudogriseolus]|uniref:hypothetical protein n=1 Tax=Streptomyces pseudogriseolus TaxID=36817 RepID=UPI0034868FF3